MNDLIDAVRAGSRRNRTLPAEVVPLDDEKQAIFDDFGPDLDAIKLPLNQVLIAIYLPPEVTKGGIIRPDVVKNEDKYQGVAGLVVKMGPHCYENTDGMDFTWTEADICRVGDWVMFRRGEGFRVDVNKRECMLMHSERGIKMVLPRPDAVF